METSMYPAAIRRRTEPVTLMRLAGSMRTALTRFVQWLVVAPTLVLGRVRRVKRPYEVVLTVLAIVVALLFAYLLFATPIARRH